MTWDLGFWGLIQRTTLFCCLLQQGRGTHYWWPKTSKYTYSFAKCMIQKWKGKSRLPYRNQILILKNHDLADSNPSMIFITPPPPKKRIKSFNFFENRWHRVTLQVVPYPLVSFIPHSSLPFQPPHHHQKKILKKGHNIEGYFATFHPSPLFPPLPIPLPNTHPLPIQKMSWHRRIFCYI